MEKLYELNQIYPVLQIALSITTFLVYLILRFIIVKLIYRRAEENNFDLTRSIYIRKTVTVSLVTLLIVIIGLIWEISFKGLSVYIASFVTIVGVGLFATWSIVSNITASVILFFFFPLKIGSKVKIMDGDNSAEGLVVSISLFSIRLLTSDGNEVYFPNNLAIQRSITHLKD